MARQYDYSYEDFRPLYTTEGKRDPGRRYVSPSTGQVIGKSSYFAHATKVARPNAEIPSSPTAVKGTGARSSTFRSGGKIGREARNASYQDRLREYVNRTNELAKAGLVDPVTREQARRSADFKMMYRAYKNTKDRTKHGARHSALIYFGILDEDDDYY